MSTRVITLLLKILITVIVGQTLFFKFSGAEESVYIFTTLGLEPWGRIMLGLLELLALILLWVPKSYIVALVLLAGMMIGALLSHLFKVGLQIMGDGGELFILALVTMSSALVLLYLSRSEIRKLIIKTNVVS